jgi:hypothetical protein
VDHDAYLFRGLSLIFGGIAPGVRFVGSFAWVGVLARALVARRVMAVPNRWAHAIRRCT